jgi:EmrB/QacA subfamily drug resistance transporter
MFRRPICMDDAPRHEASVQAQAAPLDHAAVRSIIVGIMLAMFLSALEQTIVAPALPAIGNSLADIENLSWVVTAYLLAATAATPLFGKLSDIYGRRTIMLFGIGIFIAGSVACALAPTMWALIAARALQGIGGGGLLPIAQTIIADILSPRERPAFQSYTAVMFMTSSVLGPVLGGVLTDYLHWSLIFWINLPLGLAAWAMTSRALRRLPRNDRPHRLDVLGAMLMVAAAIALMLALGWGGSHYRWTSWQILALVAGSAALWCLFALRLSTALEPFIPLSILRERIVSTMTCAAFFSIGTFIGMSIFMPLYFQLVLGRSASASGIALIACMVGATVGSVMAGRLVTRFERYMRVPLAGLLIAIVTLVLLALEPAARSPLEVTLALAIMGFGLGPMYPITTIVIQNIVTPYQLGTATGALNFFRSLGGAIIVAAFGAIVLGSVDNSADLLALGPLGPGGPTADFARAFRWVFAAGAACLAIAFVCVLAVEERPLHGPAAVAPKAAE